MRPLALLLLLCGCTMNRSFPAVTTVTGVDLRRYADSGFFFSPDPYTGPHDPVGLIVVTGHAKADWDGSDWTFAHVSGQGLLDSAYAVARKLGADAFVEMTFKPVFRRASLQTEIPGLELSGFAIRRRKT